MRVLITVNGHSGVLFIIFNTPCLKNGKRHTQCLNSRKVSHGTESQYPLPISNKIIIMNNNKAVAMKGLTLSLLHLHFEF